MREINDFTLERHTGKEETWPLRSRLIRNGHTLELDLPGYSLLRQYETVEGYLFVTDYDCPYEEITHFVLVAKNLVRVVSDRGIGEPYYSFLLESLTWRDERHFTAVLSGIRFEFTLRAFSIPFLHPALGVSKGIPLRH